MSLINRVTPVHSATNAGLCIGRVKVFPSNGRVLYLPLLPTTWTLVDRGDVEVLELRLGLVHYLEPNGRLTGWEVFNDGKIPLETLARSPLFIPIGGTPHDAD